MAEIKTGIFAKNVQKRLNRAQEKVLQKLGKADETKDEQFEQVVVNFRRQESEGSRLQREMKAYMSAIKGMQQASINLTQSLHEVYEPDWHGKDDIMVIGKDCDAMWEDFHNKLVDSTLLNLDEYLLQFPDLKTRVAKRSRKLIDYDSARHHVETLQVSGMKNDRKMMKADEELKKAQKVFEELNVGLQDELPTLWDSRVGFYISTYKSVTNLEARFHREISQVCRQLYEVMTQLAEQHSDKMFTIQGAPSDSGPLRLARTPSPTEDESPPESPDAIANHMLRPVSPGPPRPKSPIQLKKGPPVPPPPKATPTKEVAEEQIINLFGGDFLPAPSLSQPNERPGESLLDMDFDAFQPDESVSPIPQTAVPWDMWAANAQTTEPQAADTNFVADWSADFGSLPANEDTSPGVEAPAVGLEGAQGRVQGGAQDLPQTDVWQPGADKATPSQDREVATAAEEVISTFNGFSQDTTGQSFFADFDEMNEGPADSNGPPEALVREAADEQDKSSSPLAGEGHPSPPAGEGPPSPPAGEGPPSPPAGESPPSPPPGEGPPSPPAGEGPPSPPAGEGPPSPPAGEGPPSPPAGEKSSSLGSFGEALPVGAKVEELGGPSVGEEDTPGSSSNKSEPDIAPGSNAKTFRVEGIPSEKMPIPSVVIEPASSNEGDDDRDADIISPTAISDNGVTLENQTIKHMSPSGGVSGLPDDFLYKVETMHDFEAANSDELELKRGDVVLVVPTASAEDQDAGWLTGIRESEWLTIGAGAHRGLFPENFTQHLE
ncbi:amphiphysin isoform X5 [Gasterosteus aculeatus]|uniref:amphiphysin n=1 Tax=Gasterosteus aculeatus aculeatus TaxID=481459 RepID=UPI001A98287C|nr:amphiphysin [Gasterosteus aculeatus aculeatus]